MRYIGIDIHREFAEVAILEEGVARSGERVAVTPEGTRLLAGSLAPYDQVAVEATVKHLRGGQASRGASGPRVVISNPIKTRAIAEAKIKTEQIDARSGPAPGGGVPARGLAPERGATGAAAPGAAAHPDRA